MTLLQRIVACWKRGCRWLGAILLAWGADPDPVEDDWVIDPAIRRCVHRACERVGLPMTQFADDFDLEETGKVQAVLHYAARFLGIDHGLHSVGDVVVFLAWAQKAQR
jgi:hypothetical protein